MRSSASTASPRRWRSRFRRSAHGCATCSTATCVKIVGLLNLTERPELISAIVGINAQGRGRAREIAQRIADLPFVNSASVVTGRFDIIVDVTVAGDVADLYRITSELIPGVGEPRRNRAQRDLRCHGVMQQMGEPARRLLVGRVEQPVRKEPA